MAACSVVPSESPLHQLIGNVGMHGKVIVHTRAPLHPALHANCMQTQLYPCHGAAAIFLAIFA